MDTRAAAPLGNNFHRARNFTIFINATALFFQGTGGGTAEISHITTTVNPRDSKGQFTHLPLILMVAVVKNRRYGIPPNGHLLWASTPKENKQTKNIMKI